MLSRFQKIFFVGVMLVASLALAAPAGAKAKSVTGTVVHKSNHAHSFVLATKHGSLVAIHAKHTPRVGRHAHATVRSLSNGTLAATSVKSGGKSGRVRFHGTVTFVDRRTG